MAAAAHQRLGLRCDRATTSVLVLYCAQLQSGRAEAVTTLPVDVPRARTRRNRAGPWYSVRDIPPDRIRRVLSFAELAGAYAA
jgi:hypothetical protein